MAKFCKHCGTALTEGTKFCKGCGKAVSIPQTTVARQQPQDGPQQSAAANICQKCGAALKPGAKFCKGCGTSTAAATEPQTQQAAAQAAGVVSQLAGGMVNASSMSGETVLGATGGGAILGALGGASNALQYINPLKALISGALNMFKSLGTAFKSGKFGGIVAALILAAVWLLLTLLPALGISLSIPAQCLSWLTFAEGGLRGGIGGALGGVTGILGGMLGKGLVAGLITSIIMSLIHKQNPFKSIGGGMGKMFSAPNFKQPGPMLLGVGIALIGYNFMAGTASLSGTMAGIAAFLMTLKALGSRAGFLRNLLGGLLAKKKKIDTAAVNTCMAGMAAGFALSVPLSAVPWAYAPYAAGAVLLVVGIILAIALKRNKEVAAI